MKEFVVQWSKGAEFDLEQIIEYIKVDSIESAKKIFFEMKEACDALYYFPQRKRIVPELQQIGISKYREIIFKRWRVIFKVEAEVVYVLMVLDSRRDMEDLLFQRLIQKNDTIS